MTARYTFTTLSTLVFAFAQAQTIRSIPLTDQRTHAGSLHSAPEGALCSLEMDHVACLNEEAARELWMRADANVERIRSANPAALPVERGNHPLFTWPTRPKAGFDEPGYYTVNFLVDHNTTPNNNLRDYNCGTRTYDWATGNHLGTDIILWPYAWRRMDEGVMEVIAAAPGTIVDKRTGFSDTQCVNAGDPNWNGVVVQHSDGSRAIYMHFKAAGITPKGVGETVEAGEYLGLAGSSGSSNWPHLHFEVRDAGYDPIDPWAGPCNSFNGDDSWWAEQQPVYVPRINHISTHYTRREFYQCPVPETTYEQSNFEIGDSLVMKLYFRDLNTGAVTDLRIRNAQGTVVTSWDFASPWSFAATTWGWWFWVLDNSWATGAYTFEATFDGQDYVRPFTIGMPIGMDEAQALPFRLMPNPANETLRLSELPQGEGRASIVLYDATGRVVRSTTAESTTAELSVYDLPAGAYQLELLTDRQRRSAHVMITH